MTVENCNAGCFRGRRGHGGHGCNGDCNERIGLIVFYQKATELSSFNKLQIWKGKELAGNLFASQNREALCSTALVNLTTLPISNFTPRNRNPVKR